MAGSTWTGLISTQTRSFNNQNQLTSISSSSRWYAEQDANWNVTAMLNSNGSVANRFVYDPYGKGNVYDANWNLQGALIGGLGSTWKYFFQGGRFDAITGLYNFRNRDLSV